MLKNDRGLKFGIGSRVKFQTPIKISDGYTNLGTIKYIDGAYIGIQFIDDGEGFIAERYPNEILAVYETD